MHLKTSYFLHKCFRVKLNRRTRLSHQLLHSLPTALLPQPLHSQVSQYGFWLRLTILEYKYIEWVKWVKSLSGVRLFATPWTIAYLPGSSVHGIFQARILEWVAISFSRGSSRPRDRTRVSHIVGRRFTVWATREAHKYISTF